MRVVDLGCGTGELTRELHRTLRAAETLGLDNSDAMLQKSGEFAGDGLSFLHGDIAAFNAEGSYDVVFSNAALHWLPDHRGLFARLTRALAPGGQLAVQMPANVDHPSHAVAGQVADEEPFRGVLGGVSLREALLPPEGYAALLDTLGYTEQHVRLQVYVHHLESRDAVVEWVKGSTLTDYQRRMPPELFERFLARYRERLLPELAGSRPFLYTFKRLLLWGKR
jgi:trans-aconitate 2-methyltransferase